MYISWPLFAILISSDPFLDIAHDVVVEGTVLACGSFCQENAWVKDQISAGVNIGTLNTVFL